LLRLAGLGVVLLTLLSGATYTVGQGAPTDEDVFLFQAAYGQNGFSAVAGAPLSSVKTLQVGSIIGLYQEFSPTSPSSTTTAAPAVTYGLVMPNENAPASTGSVYQVMSGVMAYYLTVGPAVAGFPTSNTQNCPSVGPSACTYQLFTNDYALFAYNSPLPNGQTCEANADTNCVYIKDPEYTKWQSLGGVSSSVGLPISVTTNITASTTTTATQQLFTGGAFYGITSGSASGGYYAVTLPIYTTYESIQGPYGTLGLPTSNQQNLPNGVYQQTFEGGTIQYTTGQTPVILLPVKSVQIVGPQNFTTGTTLNLNGTATLTANAYSSTGASVTGRAVTWAATNPSVLSLKANGATATVTGIGGGTSNVTATVGGVVSSVFPVTVNAPCCTIGYGAPSTVQSAFLDALSRNQFTVTPPVPAGAQRAGSGYIQTMTPAGSTQSILVAEADGSSLAYVVSGAILTAYENAGGPTGVAGYPTADATAGGRQMFVNAAIAGNPAYLLTGQMLAKWSALGYETGSLGLPTSAASAYSTSLGEAGLQQAFQNGTIFGFTSGPHLGGTYAVSGAILSFYNSQGGPSGTYGAPVGDVTASGITYSQAFENGTITYNVGDSAAVGHPNPRIPSISSFPPAGVPGSRLQLTVTGFSNNDTVTVTVGNQPGFTVTLPLGVFTWNYVIPSSATVGSVNLKAVDSAGVTVTGSFSIQSTASLGAKLTIAQGNSQTGGVSALLPIPLQVVVKDSSGNPIPNIAVSFLASPGATISVTSAVTDNNGLASTTLRLPSSSGIAEVTAQALGQYVTFGAQAVATPALSVPAMTATSQSAMGAGTATIAQQGALLTSAAMVLAYYQTGGKIGSPNGQATADTLNKYLANCGTGCDGFLSSSASGQQVVNLWRLSGFSGGLTDISVVSPDASGSYSGPIQALVAGGTPVMAFLSLSANGVGVGGSTVVVTGVNSDGSLVVNDPNPVLARTNLNDYLNGFLVGSATWRGTIVSAAAMVVSRPPTSAFILGSVSQPDAGGGVSLDVQQPGGYCGPVVEIPDAATIGSTSSVTLRSSRFVYCNGADAGYQADISATGAYQAFIEGAGLVKDLSASSPASYALAYNSSGTLTIAPEAANFTANGVLNAATFTQGLAPGGLFSIFGTGLAGSSGATTVKFGSETAQLILSSPFQLNGQVPADLAPGSYSLTVQSAFGSMMQPVAVSQTAPGIFVVAQESGASTGNRTVGAVINQNGALNDVGSPANRGDVLTVYCTGLGAVQAQGNLWVTVSPVTAILNAVELPVAYSGYTPGFIGLYQVNVPVPGGTSPGANLSLTIKAAGVISNTVNVAIQ
jgi:uncharacterized protein (TIGR03437 family)